MLLLVGKPETAGDFHVNLKHTENNSGERCGERLRQVGFVINKPADQIHLALLYGGGELLHKIQIDGDIIDLLI